MVINSLDGINFVAIVGLIASALAFELGFIPPSELVGVPTVAYQLIVFAITFGLAILPIIIYVLRKPHWRTINDKERLFHLKYFLWFRKCFEFLYKNLNGPLLSKIQR